MLNLAESSDEKIVQYLDEYFKRFDIKLTDGEAVNGCRLLVWGDDEIVVESDRGDKYLIPRHSIKYITLEHAISESARPGG